MSEHYIIKNAKFITSAVDKKLFLDDKPQIAFVGRSNVGKSSLLNALTKQKKLAKISSVPGLTKMVNYFLINSSFYFVDLPGYGFSKTGKTHQKLWSTLIEDYLLGVKNLKEVFLLVDIRHEPSELDILMQKFLFYHNIPYRILATKADKIVKSKINAYLSKIATTLQVTVNNIIPCSAESKLNMDKIIEIIGDVNEQ